jgi:hypothetical protein
MKIIEEKRKNIALFGDVSIGTIFVLMHKFL